MRTNIIIDDELMQKALTASGLPTKRAAVEAGLRLLIAIQGQTAMRKYRGKVVWEGNLEEMRAGRIAEEPHEYRP